MTQSSNGTTQASQVLEGRGGVTLTLRGPSLSDSNMVHRSVQTPANGMPSRPGLVLINRAFLRYRYGVMPSSATALSSSSTKGRRSRAHRQEQYPSLTRDDFRLFKNAPVKRKEIVDSLFFYSHVPTCQALLAINKPSLDPEHYHAAYIFNRACDFLRKGKPEVFNAHEKALQFHYFRSQYHSGLCSTPPDTLTPQDVDRLRTAGFIKDEELDFIPALHLLALGVYARSSLLARFPIKEPGAVPIQMRWTVGADERPSLDEIHFYCESEEDKRRKRKSSITSFLGNVRPRVTRKWEEYSLQNYGVYGLESLKRPVMDSEVAKLLTENDFTYVTTKGQAVVEPDNLINFGSPTFDTTPADVLDCTPLPVELDLSAGYAQSSATRASVDTVSKPNSEASSDSEECVNSVNGIEANSCNITCLRSTTPESTPDIGSLSSCISGDIEAKRVSHKRSEIDSIEDRDEETVAVEKHATTSADKDVQGDNAEHAQVDDQKDISSFEQATLENNSVEHTEPFSSETQSTVDVEENDLDGEHITENLTQVGKNTTDSRSLQTDDEDLEYILRFDTGASVESPNQYKSNNHAAPVSNEGSEKERKGGKSVQVQARTGNTSNSQEVQSQIPSCRQSERIRIRRLSMEQIEFQSDGEKQEEQSAENSNEKTTSTDNIAGLGRKAKTAGSPEKVSEPDAEEDGFTSESDGADEAHLADEANGEAAQNTRPVAVVTDVRAGKRKRPAEQEQEHVETGSSIPRQKRTRPMPRSRKAPEAAQPLPHPVNDTISAGIVSSASGIRRSARLCKKGKKIAAEDAPQRKPGPRGTRDNHGKSQAGAKGKTKSKAVTPNKKAPVNSAAKPCGKKQTRPDKVTHTDNDDAVRAGDDSEQAVTVVNCPGPSREAEDKEEVDEEPQKGRYALRQRQARGKKE